MELTQALKNNFVFRGLPESFINMVAAYANVRSVTGGETIIRQFDRSQDLIVILEGEAITRSFTGQTVAQYGPGTVLGEMALVDGAPRSATVTSVGKTCYAIISSSCLKSLLDLDAFYGQTFYENIAKVLARRLRTMNEGAGVLAAAR